MRRYFYITSFAAPLTAIVAVVLGYVYPEYFNIYPATLIVSIASGLGLYLHGKVYGDDDEAGADEESESEDDVLRLFFVLLLSLHVVISFRLDLPTDSFSFYYMATMLVIVGLLLALGLVFYLYILLEEHPKPWVRLL